MIYTEDDFIHKTVDGREIDAIFLGVDSEYIVTYGHVDNESILSAARQIIVDIGEDPDDPDLYDLEDETQISWRWARPCSGYADEWNIYWGEDVTESTPDSFPVTVLTLW